MLNLRPHHRIRIPNSLALFALLLALIVSATNYVSVQTEAYRGLENGLSEGAAVDNAINVTVKKSRGLNLGLLLFRRG